MHQDEQMLEEWQAKEIRRPGLEASHHVVEDRLCDEVRDWNASSALLLSVTRWYRIHSRTSWAAESSAFSDILRALLGREERLRALRRVDVRIRERDFTWKAEMCEGGRMKRGPGG